MVTLSDWQGLIGSRQDHADVRARAILDNGRSTMCCPFRVEGDDGAEYFVKCETGAVLSGSFALAIEFVVAGVGRLIGAPMAETKLIEIPEYLSGWPLCDGALVNAGVAHASRAIDVTSDEESDVLRYRTRDDNARRHAGVHALYDWCFGEDPQWIYDATADLTTYTFDHDQWLQPELHGDGATLMTAINDPHPLGGATKGLDKYALEDFRTALAGVTRSGLVNVLASVPASWAITNQHLELIGYFLEHRAPDVRERLRDMI